MLQARVTFWPFLTALNVVLSAGEKTALTAPAFGALLPFPAFAAFCCFIPRACGSFEQEVINATPASKVARMNNSFLVMFMAV
jgi:hypothetical protein